MLSHITKLYDYAEAVVPDEIRFWRVPDSEIQERLELFSGAHARETEPETVAVGDSVSCRGESAAANWNRPVLLFYPGHGLCEKVLEDALIGMRTGESKTVSLPEGDVTLTVARIIRTVPHPINDELVRLENIEGVSTVEEYRRWYRETIEAKQKDTNCHRAANWLLREIKSRSEFFIDQEEFTKWGWKLANNIYDRMVENGQDPTVPEAGTEFLTEEQARQQLFDRYADAEFRSYLTACAVVEKLSGEDLDEVARRGMARMAETYGMSVEELVKISKRGDFLRADAIHIQAIQLLLPDMSRYLED